MACTASRMVEHLLDSRLDANMSSYDPAMDDFLLTHVVFLSPRALVQELRKHYSMDSPHHDRELSDTYRRRVVFFMYRWVTTIRHPLFYEPSAVTFIEVYPSVKCWIHSSMEDRSFRISQKRCFRFRLRVKNICEQRGMGSQLYLRFNHLFLNYVATSLKSRALRALNPILRWEMPVLLSKFFLLLKIVNWF